MAKAHKKEKEKRNLLEEICLSTTTVKSGNTLVLSIILYINIYILIHSVILLLGTHSREAMHTCTRRQV
jgi:hypothetical protein